MSSSFPDELFTGPVNVTCDGRPTEESRGNNGTHQVRYFDEAFQAFTESSVCQGMIWWIAFDYYGQNYYNNMGIFNHNRTIAYETQAHMRWAYGNFTKENL